MERLEEYLARLARLDVKLWVDEGKLRCTAPDAVLTSEFRAELAQRKPELLVFLARSVAQETSHSIPRRTADQTIPLTLGQQRIWSLAKMEPSSSVYNVPTVFHLQGALDVSALEKALNALQLRHEVLRTVFTGEDVGSARQQVLSPGPMVLTVTQVGRDLARLPPPQARRAMHELLQAEVRKPFDLARGPLWRARLLALRPGQHVLVLTMHHIIFDGLSKTIFLRELSQTYQAIKTDGGEVAAAAGLQFADFAVWQQSRLNQSALAQQMAYWTDRLSGEVPPLVTPNQKPRRAGKGRAGAMHFELPPKLIQGLDELGRVQQTSMFITLLSAFNVLLNRHSGQEDLVVCAPMASREHAEIESLIGYFNNIVVIRSDLSGNPDFRSLMAQVRRLALQAFDNQHLPLQQLALLPGLLRTPLTRAMFSYQEVSSRQLELQGLVTHAVTVRKDDADFDLALYLEREGDKLEAVLDFNADIFGAEAIKRLVQRFAQVLELILDNPQRTLSEFPAYGKKPHNIEQLLIKHPQIDSAVVVRTPQTGAMHAYLVLNEHDVPDLNAVRAYAAAALPDYKVPASFIPVDEMPLLPDGSVDLAALPVPGAGRSRLSTPYVEPRTPLEQELAALWKKVLWLDHEVGLQDKFRELGGHSLLSVQLVLEVEKTLQRRVPAWALAKLDTVQGLAQALEASEGADAAEQGGLTPGGLRLPHDLYHGLRSHTASWEGVRATPESVIVGLNTQGKRQSLFWCLQRYQELTQLARYLGAEQPVYGMRSGNRVMVKTQDNINLLGAHYADEILGIQPQGPYLIGGNCQAAQIAFQVAAQLKRLGHEITLLILQEKFIPFAYDGPVALMFGDKSDYNPQRYFRCPEAGWRKYYTGGMAMREVRGAHGQFFREPNVQVLTDTIRHFIGKAQALEFVPATDSVQDRSCQILPDEAYRVRFEADTECQAVAGAELVLAVTVVNASACTWMPAQQSGIALGNRWLHENGSVHRHFDGSTPLSTAMPPDAQVQLEHRVRVPESEGNWILEIDLVDEGVAWFKDKGATPHRVSVKVRKGP